MENLPKLFRNNLYHPTCDIVIGLQHGDEGKGKVVKSLMENGDYNICCRFNGGPNAGHTIYHNGHKIVTHLVPSGIFYNKICVIGSGCVIDIDKLKNEIIEIEMLGIDVRNNLKISFNCHIIDKSHIEEDVRTDKIGSTGSGIRPVFRDKYNRCGKRVKDLANDKLLGCEIIDPSVFLNLQENIILFEGAQGFELDIDWGKYPYVTSSHCFSGFIGSCGVSHKAIRNVYGLCKIYDTYVGNYEFQSEDEDCYKLGELGNEFGSTTGRKRQVNWLNVDRLKKAIIMNGVTKLIINKCDIIEKLGKYKILNDYNKQIIDFTSFDVMKLYIQERLKGLVDEIIFSESPYKI